MESNIFNFLRKLYLSQKIFWQHRFSKCGILLAALIQHMSEDWCLPDSKIAISSHKA